MKIMKRLYILFLIFSIWSCDTSNMFVGGGTAPDISAPEINITTPDNLAYQRGSFFVAGTVSDNIKVTKVELSVFCNGERVSDKENPPTAVVAGTQWSYEFKDLKTGEYTITVTAYDKAGNQSENSSKTIVLTVDNEESEIKIQKPNLKPQETLEGLDYRQYAYIEYFKNKTFSIQGQIKDNYPLKEITLQLFKENECVYSLTFDSKYLGRKAGELMVEGSLYNWTVTVDSEQEPIENEIYINKLSELSPTEKHYLRMAVAVTDKAGNKTASSDSQLGFICLYQEADRPWIEVSSLETADNLEMQQEKNKLRAGAQISGTAYDDDSLEMMEFYIVNTDYDEMVKHETITKASFGETGCTMWDLVAPTNQGRYRLYYRLKDSSGVTSYGNGSDLWTETSGWDDEHSIGFQVIDESAPTTEVKAFEEYPTTAYITDQNPAFIVEATTRDAAGIEKVILAWDPNASEEKATELKVAKWDIAENGYQNGIKYWIVDLKDFENVMENNTFKMDWSCELPVNDFIDENGNKVFNYKKMYYCTISKSGNYAVGTFTIPKEFNEPVLSIDSPKDNDNVRNVGGEHFTIEGKCSDAQSGIASLIIEYKDSSGKLQKYDLIENNLLAKDGTWSVTSNKLQNLGGSYQRIVVKALDYFGNISQSSVYVKVDDNSPQVVSVSIDEPGEYYSVGDTLHFRVTMNRKIEIKGDEESIYLELNCREGSTNIPKAVYDGFEEEKTLKFKYTVQSGDNADPLDYLSSDSIKMADGTVILGKAEGEGVSSVPAVLTLVKPGDSGSLSSRGVFIDTEKPYITVISTNVGQGAYTVGQKIRISAQLNEVISGKARILVNSRPNDPNDETLFVGMEDRVEKSDTLDFVYTVEEGDKNADGEFLDIYVPVYADKYNPDTYTVETVRDEAGNEMNFENFPVGEISGSLASLGIKIDTEKPTLKNISVKSVIGTVKNGKYYLNAGKTVTLEVEFSELMFLGKEQPTLHLNALNGEKAVKAQYQSGSGSTFLTFVYTVAAGDNSPVTGLTCTAFEGDVTDEAGNPISGSVNNKVELANEVVLKKSAVDDEEKSNDSSTSYTECSIIVDTAKPEPPAFNFKDINNQPIGSFDDSFNALGNRATGRVYTGIASGYTNNITVEPVFDKTTSTMTMYAITGGHVKVDWLEQTDYTTDTKNAEQDWTVKAQLTDFAGNVSDVTSATFKVDNGLPLLSSITTTSVNGLYKSGMQIPVTLTFSKRVNAKESGDGDIKLTFNNEGYVTFVSSEAYSAMYKGIYYVGTGDTDIAKLEVKDITGGIFSDTVGNKVEVTTGDLMLAVSTGFANDFKEKNIQIDKTAPKLNEYKIESISDESHSDENSYYLNAGKTVKIAAIFDEPVIISGDSKIKLCGDKNATYTGTSDNKKTLYYTYTVAGNDNLASLAVDEEKSFPGAIQDIAGNTLDENGSAPNTELKYKEKSIVIDTIKPSAPDVTLTKASGSDLTNNEMENGISEQLNVSISSTEDGTVIEYSTNGGAKYEEGTKAVLGDTGSKKTFYIVARQTDKAGNMSGVSKKITVTVDLQEMGISKITTTKVNGVYKTGDVIPVTLLFTKKVKLSDVTITFNNEKALENLSSDTLAISHQFNYTIADDHDLAKALNVKELSGTFKNESDEDVTDKITDSFGKLADNFKDNDIRIDTKSPTISSYSVKSVSDTEHVLGKYYYLNADDTVIIEVNFNEKVEVIGTSVLSLDTNENAIYLSTKDDDTLIYEYKIDKGNTQTLTVPAGIYPTNIQDVAGNILKTGLQNDTPLSCDGKSMVIDTELPPTPGVYMDGASVAFEKAKYSATEIVTFKFVPEGDAKLEYSLDAGANYTKYSDQVSLPESSNDSLNTYNLRARQTDVAGNVSVLSDMINIVVDLRPIGLKSISTTKPAGVYKAGAEIPLTFEFYKPIESTANITATLSNGANVKIEPDGKSVYTVNYTVSNDDVSTSALFVASLQGNAIKDCATDNFINEFAGVEGGASDGEVNGTIMADNLPKTDNVISIDTAAPKLTGYTVNSLGGTPVITVAKNYLNAGDSVEIAVAFDEAVTISGDSIVILNNNKKAVYTGTSEDKETLYYTYTVSGGDDIEDLGIAASIYPNNIQDIAGNVLASGTTKTSLMYNDKNIVIDTECVAPRMSGIAAGNIYNAAQTVTLSGETGAVFHYSVNGGASEAECNDGTFTTPTTEGRHPITAYQVDIAGNKSLWADAIEIIVDTAPPAIKSISTTAGSGSYKKDDKFTITAEFTENVTGNITVTLNTTTTAKVTFANITGSNTATATYTALSGHDTNALKANSVSGSITDTAGNNITTFDSGFANFAGKNIKIDTTTPEISSFSMTAHSGSTKTGTLNTILQDTATDSNIVLNFNEGVSKGSGSIKIERVYKSYPAVMEVDDYNIHKAGISDWYKQRCIGTVNNNGTEPDTNAKYVLKYDIDHGAYASESDITDSTQKAVYNYFADKEYNVTTIDVNSGLVTIGKNSSTNATSVVTIQLPSKLQKGIIYKVTFTEGTFVDLVGNKCAAESGSKVQFETGPTATPVIRINKLSGIESGSQPYTTGVKVSSEMYGATLSFAKSSNTVSDDSNKVSKVTDPTSYTTRTNSSEVTISDTSKKGEIFKLWAKATKTGLTNGDVCKELAYKTVIKLGSSHYVRGSDSTGGVSATTEFPASWYDSLSTAQGGSSCWVTWHILKSFQWKEYDPYASSNNNGKDERWIGSENEVTKPGSCDSIDAAEVSDGDDSGDSGNTGSDDGKIYLIPTSTWDHSGAWFAAYFFGNGDKWVKMTEESKGVYVCEKPSGYPSVIFVRMNSTATATNWEGKWNQTVNETIPTDGKNCFTITGGSNDTYSGTWSTK